MVQRVHGTAGAHPDGRCLAQGDHGEGARHGAAVAGCGNEKHWRSHMEGAAPTVKTHLLHIYAKLGVNDRAAAVATGFERSLLPRTVD